MLTKSVLWLAAMMTLACGSRPADPAGTPSPGAPATSAQPTAPITPTPPVADAGESRSAAPPPSPAAPVEPAEKPGFPAPVAMDGPIADPCKEHAVADVHCDQVGATKLGTRTVAVFRHRMAGDTGGDFYVAVELADGWRVAHDPIFIEANWKEHGPSHIQTAGKPHFVPLALASKRPAIAVDIPVLVVINNCYDQSDPTSTPANCGSKPAKGSLTALIACGERSDKSWACLPPIDNTRSHQTYDPPPRFRPDGSIAENSQWRGYDVAPGERVEF